MWKRQSCTAGLEGQRPCTGKIWITENAYGIDLGFRLNQLLVSGEYIIQRNKDVKYTAPNITLLAKELSSNSAYLQFDYALTEKLHLYGLYDYWKLKADNETVNRAAVKVFHGVKYFINPKTRWTILEHGRMFHTGFDKGNTHLSSHLEVNF
jgi:predicted porin